MVQRDSVPVAYVQYEDQACSDIQGAVPIEAAVRLYVNSQALITLMCTPTYMEELAVGFLYNQGLVSSCDAVADVKYLPEKRQIRVCLSHELVPPRERVSTSGFSGGPTFEDVAAVHPRNESAMRLATQQVLKLMEEFTESTLLHRSFGGVHGAGVATDDRLLFVVEDVGRNNALDKVTGFCLKNQVQPDRSVLLVSGRVSSEMLHKVARLGMPAIVSRKSPTSLSVELARAWGITVVCYARRQSFRVYSHRERLQLPSCGGAG
jgi:FdhD protein